MNTVIASGNLTRDPMYKQTSSGNGMLKFSVASNKKVGEKEIADFIDVTVFGGLADECSQKLKKGMGVIVVGEWNCRSYTGSDGQRKYATTVIAREVAVKLFPMARNPAAFNRFGNAPQPEYDEDIMF